MPASYPADKSVVACFNCSKKKVKCDKSWTGCERCQFGGLECVYPKECGWFTRSARATSGVARVVKLDIEGVRRGRKAGRKDEAKARLVNEVLRYDDSKTIEDGSAFAVLDILHGFGQNVGLVLDSSTGLATAFGSIPSIDSSSPFSPSQTTFTLNPFPLLNNLASPFFPPISIPQPMNLFPPLPPQPSISYALNAFLTSVELTFPTVHKTRFLGGMGDGFLTMVMLTIAPVFTLIPGLESKTEKVLWESNFFSRAKLELIALIGVENPPVESVAGVTLLTAWAFWKGMTRLAWQLFSFAQVLAERVGLKDAIASSWEQLAESEFGMDVWTRNLTPPELARLRDLWISYWTHQRIAWGFSLISFETSDWFRSRLPASSELLASLKNLRPVPHPDVWEASYDPGFDPRGYRSAPLVLEFVEWIYLEPSDPRRIRELEKLPDGLLNYRYVASTIGYLLRNEVNSFLVGLKKAGLRSPFLLPRTITPDTPIQLVRLISEREKLDRCLLDARRGLPSIVSESWRLGRATPIVEAHLAVSGPFWHAYKRVPPYWTIILPRIELWSSFGTQLTALDGLAGLSADGCPAVALADEFGSGPPFLEFLEDILSFTKMIADYFGSNPGLDNHIGKGIPHTFLVAVVHIGFLKKFQRTDPSPALLTALSQIQSDVEICLSILHTHSLKFRFVEPIYSLALKLFQGSVEIKDVQEAWWEREVEEPGDAREMADVLEVYGRFGR